jgi:acyl phosphate:glycerol-3-phosphate acyltransferase
LIVAIAWLLVFATSRYVSIASLAAALMLPIATAVIEYRQHALNRPLLFFFSALALLICLRHRTNVARLMAGTEPRFSRK